ATIVLSRVETPLEYGVVIIDEQGKILRFLEKPGWGEVFSDTVNTGIYVLEPDVFKLMKQGEVYDWSKNIFPQLLEGGMPLYGCVLDGYWCDIGNLKQYREVHEDALKGKVKIKFPGKKVKRGLWIGENCEIAPTAQIHPPAIIGNNCKIKDQAVISEFSVVGDNCILGEKSNVARSIVWNNTFLGRETIITGATILQNNVIEEKSRVKDGAIIGDNCNIGKGSTISQQVKIWPGKIIESGASINMSIVWAQNWPGTLFSALGVKGIGNIQITPEYAAQLGSAFGAYLPGGSTVITTRSPHKLARVIKRALISGLMSVGVDVIDARNMPIPVTRHIVRTSGAVAGIHTRISPYEPEMILIEFFDENGINIDTNAERKVEAIFFRQDFRRADKDNVGQLNYDAAAFQPYADQFMKFIKVDAIRERKFRIVIDYSHGSLSTVLPPVLSRYGLDAVSLNAYIDPEIAPRSSTLDKKGLRQLGSIAKTLDADLGLLVDGESEKIALVSGDGEAVFGERLLALMLRLIGNEYDNPIVAAQVRAPLIVNDIIRKIGGSVVVTKANSRSLMVETFRNQKICFGGDTKGGFMFPKFSPAFDALVSLSKILEIVATHNIDLNKLIAEIPQIHIAEDTMGCGWDVKGRLMRVLVEKYKNKKTDLTDGVKLSLSKNSWVLMRPHPSEPTVNVVAEAGDMKEARAIVKEYKKVLKEIING
ncbi:MAG: sugar phosphate nucleotidyltransferase, partial [bacterium]